jgi:hypothetical protein
VDQEVEQPSTALSQGRAKLGRAMMEGFQCRGAEGVEVGPQCQAQQPVQTQVVQVALASHLTSLAPVFAMLEVVVAVEHLGLVGQGGALQGEGVVAELGRLVHQACPILGMVGAEQVLAHFRWEARVAVAL